MPESPRYQGPRWARFKQGGGRRYDLISAQVLVRWMQADKDTGRPFISQATLAERVSCHKSFIGHLCKGTRSGASAPMAEAIVAAIGWGCTLDALFVVPADRPADVGA
jgi:hypothetical protein